MSYEQALADLKEQFGPKRLLDTQDVADAIGRSREALAMMRSRKQFPIARKHGRRVVVSIYDLAKYIAGDEVTQVSLPSAPSKPSLIAKSSVVTSRSRRPPSLARALSSFRQSIAQQELQIQFQNGVFANIEALELAASSRKFK